jgi:ornithine cyclodeaminase/alanine dehydrogenase-like protein (mu-crystallin family)
LDIRILTTDDVRRLITMNEAIELMSVAFAELSSGRAQVPLRTAITMERHDGTALYMPSYVSRTDSLVAKVVTIYPRNAERELPTVAGLILVNDPVTGQPKALMDAAYVTGLRTGAASGLATRLLARPEARVLAVIGAGRQARFQVEAIRLVRPISQLRLFSRTSDPARRMANDLATSPSDSLEVVLAEDSADAVGPADVVVTATTSAAPVLEGERLRPGTHVNAIGSFRLDMRELDDATIMRSRLVVDSRDACIAESGDLAMPVRAGLVNLADIGELGEVVAGLIPARRNPEEITVFKSVGNAVQDAVVAQRVVQRAEELGLGKMISL